MFIKIIMLVGLIRLLIATHKPLLCAGLYTGVVFLFALLFGNPFVAVLFGTIIAFGLSLLYFWLLERFYDSGIIWWIIMLGGIFIGLV